MLTMISTKNPIIRSSEEALVRMTRIFKINIFFETSLENFQYNSIYP